MAAILQDWESIDQIRSYYENSTDSMLIEQNKTMQTLSANLTNLKTAGQEFFSKFFDTDKATDFLKVLTNITQGLTNLVDTLGAIPTILGTIGATALLKNGGITGTITALSQFLSGNLLGRFGNSMKSVSHLIKKVPNFSAVTSEGIRSLAAAVEGLNYADQAMILAQNKVTKSTIALTLATNGAESADINAAMATIGNVTAKEKLTEAELANILTLQYGNRERAIAVASQIAKTVADQNGTLAIENLTVAELKNIATTNGLTTAEAVGTAQMLGMKSATLGLSGAMGTLGTVISNVLLALKTIAPELILISAAIAGIIAIWKYISRSDEQRKKLSEESENRKQKYQEEIETAKKMSTEYSNSAKSLENYADKYTKLSKKISLSSEDKEELISVQKELIDTYGSEANGIDLINGKYEENIKLLTQLTQKERERARQNAQAAYYDSKGQTFARNENGGSKVIDKYQGVSKKDSDKVYRKIMNYAEALKLLEESTFGDGSYWGSETVLSFNPSMSTDELIWALDAQINAMDQYFDREEKATITWQEQYAKLTALRTEAIEQQKEEVNILNNYANSIVESYINNEIDFSNVTEETYQAWHDGLIAQFASDDPDLRNAIEDKLQSMFDWLGGGNKTTVAFDWSTFADEQGLEDIEKLLGKIQTAYKNLEETGNGFALDSDILSAFPDLAKYLDDAEILKFKLQQLANAQMQPLIDQLRDIQSTLNPLSSDYSEVENLIKWLQQQADVTTKVKEKTTKVSDLYKDQKLQIHENIQALEREVKTIDKQIDALEKKKDLQEKYIKTLEKEKDRLEGLIDDYETAASVVKDYIDEQNDSLEKQKDKIEERYDAQIKAIEETYDKQVKLIEAQEEGFDKQIKALQDEADEQDRLNKLKEKELALEKAKNEKVRVYDQSRGWIITEDSEKIAAARKELEEAQREDTIAKLEKEKERLEQEKERLQADKEQRTSEIENLKEKEIEALQAEMDKLKEYKKAWEEAIGAYKKAQEEMTAAAILGADWRVKVAGQDTEIIEDYKNNYEDLQNQLNNSVIPMIEIANKELDTYSEQIDKLKEQKDLYKDMEDNQKKYLDFYKTYADQFADATNQQKEAVEALNKAIAINTALSNMNDTDKTWDWAKSLFDEDYIREYPDFKGGTTNAGITDKGFIGKLMGIFNQSTSVYDSFAKTIPNLLNNASSSLSDKIINAGKMIADTVTNNKNNVDNRTQTINVNNPGFAMTESAFMSMLTGAFVKMNQEAQTGRK